MQTFLEIGLSNAIMASALAVLVAGAGLLCRRPAIRHTLWLLVLLKLLTPPVMSVPVTCPRALAALLPVDADRAPVQSWERVRNEAPQVDADDYPDQVTHDPVLGDFGPVPVTPSAPHHSANDQEYIVPSSTFRSGLPLASWVPVVLSVWVTGSAVWFAVAGARIYRFQRLLRYGRSAPASLQDQTSLLAGRLGLARCPTVWLVPGRVSPLLWALGRELCLVVPTDLLDRLGPEQRISLLAHELAHARRRDHWVRWLEFVVSGLYWWLPAVWWARRELQQAEEECCDAWVVWTLPAAAKAYAKALLQTVDFLDARPALPPVASGIGHLRLLRRRLSMIVRPPFCPQLPWPVHLAVIVLGLLVLPFAPQRLAAQSADVKPAAEVSADLTLVRAEQDSSDRDVERRLRTLEEKMDRLMQKLDAQRGDRSDGRSSRESEEKARAAEERARARAEAERAREKARAETEKAKAKAKADAEKAREKARADQKDDLKRQLADGKNMSPEQIQRLMKEIQEKVHREVNPERMREIQKQVQDAVEKSLNPARMEAIQRKVEDALKKSTAELERAKQKLQQAAEQQRSSESRQERSRDQEQRSLERRMDRLEQKMDRVLQALEKSAKSASQ